MTAGVKQYQPINNPMNPIKDNYIQLARIYTCIWYKRSLIHEAVYMFELTKDKVVFSFSLEDDSIVYSKMDGNARA